MAEEIQKVKLVRTESGPMGTFGRMEMDDEPLCVTCEDPPNNNARGISCIPAGIYDCVPHNSDKFPNVWEVTDVPNRTAILIHNGNTIDDTHGCILVGESFMDFSSGRHGVINSRKTLEMLRDTIPDNFTLEIIEDF